MNLFFFFLDIIFVFSWREGGVLYMCILHTKSYDIFLIIIFLIIVMSFFLLCNVSFHKQV